MAHHAHSPYSELIHRALDFAAIRHQDQYRKNRDRPIPYVSHCAAVGQILERAGFDDEVVAAGILHDTMEDAKVSFETLRRDFGDHVAVLVDQVSEQDKTLSWAERKRRYIERLGNASFEALAISCADKIHNIRSLILYRREGHDVWAILNKHSGREAQLARFRRMAELFEARFDHPLRDVFLDTLDLLEREC